MENKELVMTNSLEEVSRLPSFLEEIAGETAMDAAEMMSLNVALEEALVNVIRYAYPQSEIGKIVLSSVWDEKNRELCFCLKDWGTAFDPLTVPEADVTLSLEERPIGGLGIFLIRKMMDEVTYKREGDCNMLIMKKEITQSNVT
mgnify:CR=1 FL=1